MNISSEESEEEPQIIPEPDDIDGPGGMYRPPGLRRQLTGRIRRPDIIPRRVVPRPHRPGVRHFPPFRPGLSFVLVA